MRIALAGGGSADDSQGIDRYFASWLTSKSRLLYLPIACGRPPGAYADTYSWICGVFEPLGMSDIVMWDSLQPRTHADLQKFDAVYIGGGDTYLLLHELRRTGFDRALQMFAAEGKPVYGGSAGAAILGASINTIAHLDINNVGLLDTTGLNLLEGRSVWVHYVPAERRMIDEYNRTTGGTTFVLTERSGIAIDGQRVVSAGREPAFEVDPGGWWTIDPAQ